MNRFAKLALSLGLVIATATGAAAADSCLQMGGMNYVGRGFKKPSPGKCKPFTGFVAFGYPGDSGVTGSACASNDGTHVEFTLTELERNNGKIMSKMHLTVIEFPSSEGNDYWEVPSVKTNGVDYAYFIYPCSHMVQP